MFYETPIFKLFFDKGNLKKTCITYLVHLKKKKRTHIMKYLPEIV